MPEGHILNTRTRHGFAKKTGLHPVYVAWLGMRQRCHNPRNKDYPNYGGRGLTVCQRWRDSFLTFWADVGERPEGCSLDRIDNNRGYEPGNVRWALLAAQNRNTRAAKLSESLVGELRRLYASGWAKRQLARHFCVTPKTVRDILAGSKWKPLPE